MTRRPSLVALAGSRRRTLAFVAIGAFAAVAAAGCSSSSEPAASLPGAITSASAAASGPVSGTPGMLPPIIVTPGQDSATVAVGGTIDIVVDEVIATTVDTDRPDLLEVSQAHETDGATFNPGATALAPGTATITVTNPDNSTWDIAVTITP